MSKLLRAGFTRLFRLKSFYLSLAVIAFEVIPGMLSERLGASITNEMTEPFAADPYLSTTAIITIILAAVVIGNLIGSEYGFGTMRNKLAVGHNRTEIYFANLIVSFAGILIMLAFGAALAFAVGLPLGALVADSIHLQFITHAVLALVISSLYVFIAMNIQSRSNILTAAIILGVVMLVANVVLMQQLAEPETVLPKEQVFNEEGELISEVVSGDPIPNPYYVGGTKRVIMEVTDTLLPCSAAMEYGGRFEADKVIAELCETVIFTAAGLLIFRRLDLK